MTKIEPIQFPQAAGMNGADWLRDVQSTIFQAFKDGKDDETILVSLQLTGMKRRTAQLHLAECKVLWSKINGK